MMVSEERSKTVTERTFQNIIDYITENELEEGSKLPSERELSEMFHVGRPAIREALKIADAFGIVEIRQYDGIYITGQEPQKISAPFKVWMDMGKFTLAQLFEVRRLFEVEIIKLASQRISNEEVEHLDGILKKEDIYNADQFAQCDSEFHTTIYRATGNSFLVFIMQMVNELSSISRRVTGRFEETRRIVHKDHLAILDALQKRDEQKCADSMLQHLSHIQKIVEIDAEVYEKAFLRQLKSIVKNDS